jgi:maltose alpha-D-glucosyltransferase / alpha-amylase
MNGSNNLSNDPLWYKDAIFYELRVRSFYDSSGDGIGDFPGLTAKLDYLRDLGVTALWLLPFYPSPQRDDGYDISDYLDVHPDCGTLREFAEFLREAHRRGLRVVTELVLNHTSDQHPWFQRARRAPKGDPARDFYVWSDTADRYPDVRIIFPDFEPSNWTWDPIAHAYYWHRFFAHQPDLNFDNLAVRKAVIKVLDFWLEMGIDGFRLDAVPYLFERDGTDCENLPETHEFLRDLRAHIDRNFHGRMLLAEANQWPEDAVTYLAGGKECHMAFHFPLMPRIFIAVRTEDRFPIADIWAQTPAIDDSCQWALFLRNHDELTLETVTDEERDYMLRAYAQEARMRINLGIRRRLAPLLGNNRRSIELVNGLLFSLPGTPVIYYGDEIGMGDNIYLGDRDGVRTPMQWSGDRNAGFSSADSQRLILPPIIDHEYHYQTVNVEAQERNRHSLLWWIRRLIGMRKRFKAFGRGTIEFLSPDNPRVLAFIRAFEDERILVVANLSRFVQFVELDLVRFKGLTPVELFGQTNFPAIGEQPYMMTLAPHMFDWFSLETPAGATIISHSIVRPDIELAQASNRFAEGDDRQRLESVLPDYLRQCRWLQDRAGKVRNARIADIIPLAEKAGGAHLALIDVEFTEGEAETYVLPLAIAENHHAHQIRANTPQSVIANVRQNGSNDGRERIVFDATADPAFARELLDVMSRRRNLKGEAGSITGSIAANFAGARRNSSARKADAELEPRLLRFEHSNASIALGDRLIVKLFRRLEHGESPDLEVGRFLTDQVAFTHSPPLIGSIDYRGTPHNGPHTMAVLHGYVANQGDAWEYSRSELSRYFERAATRIAVVSEPTPVLAEMIRDQAPDDEATQMIGAYLEAARLMGRRTAELHLALASRPGDRDFAPELCLPSWQRPMYQSMRNIAGHALRTLGLKQRTLDTASAESAARILAHRERIESRLEAFLKQKLSVARIRCHGNLHLGQILYTGNDFVIIDFDGEPARPLSDRRRKRTAMRDLATMLRSFHRAAFGALADQVRTGALGERDFNSMEQWALLWQTWTSRAFLKEYLAVADGAPFVPQSRDELRVMLEALILERALYELGRELGRESGTQPQWAGIALHSIEQIVGQDHLVHPPASGQHPSENARG